MNKVEFEAAVSTAIDASANNGAKWHLLAKLFATNRVIAGGAISNQQAEQRTRIRQLLTRRDIGGKAEYFRFGVFVLNQDQALRHAATPDKVLKSVIGMMEAERPQLAPQDCLECVLIIRHDGGHVYQGLALVTWGNGALTQLMKQMYPGAELFDFSATLATTTAANGSNSAKSADAVTKPGDNVIFFAPPVRGKATGSSVRLLIFLTL